MTATEPTGRLRDAYVNPQAAAAAARADGRKVVGFLGPGVPVELLEAAGVFPLALSPITELGTPLSAPYVDDDLELETRLLVESALRGNFDVCDMLVLAPSSEAHLYAYRFLKEISRLGASDAIPPIHVFDMMQARKPWIEAHSRRQFERLRRRLEVLTATTISDDDLVAAIETGNRDRAARGRVADLRLDGRIGGNEAFVALAAGNFMETAEHASLLEDLVSEAEQRAPHDRPRVAVVPSTPLFHDRLHSLCEAQGLEVVAEDDWWGSCAVGIGGDASPIPTTDPFESLFQRYYRTAPTSQVPFIDRYSLTLSLASAGAVDGVMFLVSPADGYFGWIYPDLLEAVAGTGVPTTFGRAETLTDDGAAELARIAGEFAGRLRSEHAMVEAER